MCNNNQNLEKSIPPRFQVLNTQISALTSTQLLDIVRKWIKENSKQYINIFAVANVLSCIDEPRIAAIANNSGLTLPDGMPLVFLGKRAGLKIERCYGPDMMLKIIQDGLKHKYKHFFYGCTNEVLDMLENKLENKFPGIEIVGKIPSPFRPETDEEIIRFTKKINDSMADIVWVGNGTPLQDYWVSEYRPRLRAPVLIAVGAAFNFHAGNVKQAPRWMMKSGLEWLFRLCAEPKRLWKRYIIGNPRFIFLIIKQMITKKPAPLGFIKNNGIN